MAGTRAGCHRLLLPKVIVFRCCPPVPLTGARTACTWLFPPVDAASDPGAWTKESPVPRAPSQAPSRPYGTRGRQWFLSFGHGNQMALDAFIPYAAPLPPPPRCRPSLCSRTAEPGSTPPFLPSQCPATCRGTAFVDIF